MHFTTVVLLGFIAGATILFGLPVGRLKSFNSTLRSSLSMLAVGILVFLLVEILGDASEPTVTALAAPGSTLQGLVLALLLAVGFTVGFVGLVIFEQRLIRAAVDGGSPVRLSFMIATGIGLHNLSEGLAIGQSYAQGMSGLALVLVIGFALHNATEGFGIVGPVVQRGGRLSWGTLLLLAAIGGGPTFVGTVLGSLWTSSYLSVAVLAMAGGALLYVIKELLAGVRREPKQALIMAAVALGFIVGWGTEFVADRGVAASASHRGAEATGVVTGGDMDGVRVASFGAGPKLSQAAVADQERRADDLLHERALRPQVLADGVHRYTLTASVFPWNLYPGVSVSAWGFNGEVPGPLLRFRVGQRVEIVVHNELPQATTVHWHGLAVPNAQDGVPGVTQEPISPGGTFVYRFTVTPQMIGTHLYHTHVNDDFQMDMGLHGPLIVDPAAPLTTAKGIDALYEIGSFKIGGSEEENVFTLDGKAFPEAPALVVPEGARVRLRLVNASAEESHVMHLHGYTFRIVALDGNPLKEPVAADTVLLGPSQTADVVFTADNPGAWMFHCHILDHTINPGPSGDGSAEHVAEMGGLVTFVDVVPPTAPVRAGYLAAGHLMQMAD